jgi:HPt (histidine-containing phosphotransfer) domain-containing protein
MEPIAKPDLSAAIDKLWVRFLPEIRARVAILESAAAASAASSLDRPQREAANAAAHKLAGTLGTFNLTRGTVLARQLELMYSQETGPLPALAKRLAAITAELRTIVENRK